MPNSCDETFAEVICRLELIDSARIADARSAAHGGSASLAEVLVARGWLTSAECLAVDRLVARKLASVAEATAGAQTTSSGQAGEPASPTEESDRTIIAPASGAATLIDDSPEQGAGRSDAPPGGSTSTRYRLKSLHAVGGMGRVWRAWDEQLQREVAIKELRPDVTRRVGLVERFLREARLTGQLEHPGIIPVHELQPMVDSQGPFYAMRFVQGQTLKQAIQEHHRRVAEHADDLSLVTLLAAFVAACQTVAYAHSHGVVHRDLKSENVMLGNFGEVVVVDWGLAKSIGTAEPAVDRPAAIGPDDETADLTMEGQAVGTPAYMSPEQAAGQLELIDHRTDVYGMGAILYEILTGQPPFTGTKTIEVLLAAQRGDPRPPGEINPDVPHVLEAICLRALARDREARYSSASELALEVQRWQEAERHAAEAEVRASRERFELAVRGSQDGLWDWDLATGAVYFSPRWKSILGYEDHEIANHTDEWIARLHPDEQERVLSANYAHIQGTTEHYEYEYRLRHKDGTYRWILARGAALRDAQGKAYRMAGSHVDVTDRRRTEQRLRDIEQIHEGVMDLNPLPLVVIDREGVFLFANNAARRLLDCEIGPATALHDTPLGRPLSPEGAEHSTDQHPLLALFEGGPIDREFVARLGRRDGRLTPIAVDCRALTRAGGDERFAVVALLRPTEGSPNGET